MLPGLELAPRVHEKELDSAAYLVYLVRRAGSTSFCRAPVPPALPAVADATISRSRVWGGAMLGGEDSVRVRVIATFLKVTMVRQGSVVNAVVGINGVHIGHVLQLWNHNRDWHKERLVTTAQRIQVVRQSTTWVPLRHCLLDWR